MVLENKVVSKNGRIIDLKADTICVHGDGEHALNLLQKLEMN